MRVSFFFVRLLSLSGFSVAQGETNQTLNQLKGSFNRYAKRVDPRLMYVGCISLTIFGPRTLLRSWYLMDVCNVYTVQLVLYICKEAHVIHIH